MEYAQFADRLQTRYRNAVLAWRRGKVEQFPYGTLPPGWSKCADEGPRSLPAKFRLALPGGRAPG